MKMINVNSVWSKWILVTIGICCFLSTSALKSAGLTLGQSAQVFITQYNFDEFGNTVGVYVQLAPGPVALTDGSANPIGPNYSNSGVAANFNSFYTSNPLGGGGSYFELWYTDANTPPPNPRMLDQKGVDVNAFG